VPLARYSFGDSELAGERLAHVARVFEAPSRAFLGEWGFPGRALAVDLGCGPGHTTRLLREVLRCQRTLGLDASAAFVEAAGRQPREGIDYLRHDAMQLPFPAGPADLIYARLLLSHLAEPDRAIRGFSTQLRPGGRLLLDEVEWIRSDEPAFGRYLSIVEAMLAARGQCLYVGPRLEALAAGRRVVSSEVRRHPVDSRDAATMFSLNLRHFRHNEDVRERMAEAELDALAGELQALRERGDAEIVWGLRQLVIEA
jgi:SAM-dependent methyltransferase